METMTSSTAREPDNFDEFSMHQELLFSDSLKVSCSILICHIRLPCRCTFIKANVVTITKKNYCLAVKSLIQDPQMSLILTE